MSYLPMLLPASMLTNFTASLHSTLAVSNLPGPHVTTTMKGFVISNITFWLPNRGTTGLDDIVRMTFVRNLIVIARFL